MKVSITITMAGAAAAGRRRMAAGCIIAASLLLLVLIEVAAASSEMEKIQNYEPDFMAVPTLEERMRELVAEDHAASGGPAEGGGGRSRTKRQIGGVREATGNPSQAFPQISFRDMASIVAEAEEAINNRFEFLEPAIYESNARQNPKSPGKGDVQYFLSTSKSNFKMAPLSRKFQNGSCLPAPRSRSSPRTSPAWPWSRRRPPST